MEELEYRPKTIEFEVENDGSNMPDSLGDYESPEEALKFINSELVTINQGITVNRHMDQKEKSDIRKEYNDILENRLPVLEKEHSILTSKLNEIKRQEKEAGERLNAAISQAKILAKEVKIGLVQMNLDEVSTFKVPYEGKHYYYTFIDKELKLCRIREIPEDEKTEIWNGQAGNEKFIDDNFSSGKAEE